MIEIRTEGVCGLRHKAFICRFLRTIQFPTRNIIQGSVGSLARPLSTLSFHSWILAASPIFSSRYLTLFEPFSNCYSWVKFKCDAILVSLMTSFGFDAISTQTPTGHEKLTNSRACVEVSLIDGIVSDASMWSGTVWSPAMKKWL